MEKVKKNIKELLPYIVVIILVILFKQYIASPVIVNGSSMMNNLHNKDIMILDKIGMRIGGIDRFDIVVINRAKNKIIKRVIALPGETIEYKDNKLYINDELVEDNYGNGITYDIKRQVLPKNTYYVLGDNRNDSLDSRVFGPIEKKEIMGHATFIIYPFNRIGNR